MCRTASEKSQNASTKRNFVQLAKDIANGTAAIVQAVKVSISDFIFVWQFGVLVTALVTSAKLLCIGPG